MTDIKDQMIEAIEREGIDPDAAYEYVRESMADIADMNRAGTFGGIPESQTTEAISAPATEAESC